MWEEYRESFQCQSLSRSTAEFPPSCSFPHCWEGIMDLRCILSTMDEHKHMWSAINVYTLKSHKILLLYRLVLHSPK